MGSYFPFMKDICFLKMINYATKNDPKPKENMVLSLFCWYYFIC
jgi:hypothetical protein